MQSLLTPLVRRVAAIALLALLAPLSPARAGVVLYTNEADYLAAAGPTLAWVDFAGDPQAVVSGTGFSMDVFFGSCTDPAVTGSCFTEVFQADDAITDTGGAATPNGVGSLVWRVNRDGIHALAFHYGGGRVSQLSLVDLSLQMQWLDTSSAAGFIGLVSDAPLYGGILVTPQAAAGRERVVLDDMRLNEPGTRTVPEPAGLALAAVALVALFVVQARRPA